jgi:hypothetical protein
MKKYILILALLTSTLHAQTLRETISTTIADGSGISASRLRTTLNYLSDSTSKKVDKISGKGLSTNDFNSTYKGALDVLDANLSLKGNMVYSKTALVGFAGTEARFDGSDWEKKSGNVASNGGSYAGTIVNVSSSFYWKRKTDYVTPQMFGATADGVTDDRASFRAASSAGTGGKIIIPYDPDGYYLSESVEVYSNSTIEGEAGTVIKLANGTINAFLLLNVSNATVKNLKIQATVAGGSLFAKR